MFTEAGIKILKGNETKGTLVEKACGLLTCESYATLFGIKAMKQI